MKRFLVTAAFALSVTTAAQAANNTTMFASNYWRVTHMARNNDGKSMCIMHSQLSFASGATAFVQIKWVKGRSNPFIELDKTNWHFPSDMQVPFSIKLDNGPHEFVGVSKTDSKRGMSILLTYPLEEGSDFLDAFASAEAITISFPNGNEPRWSVKMAGSRDATRSFRSCVKILGENENSAATSPVPQAPSTSPIPDVPNPVQTVPIKKPKGDSI